MSRSSAEAEYRDVANAVAETTWLQNLLRELQSPLYSVTIVYCDNVSAVYLSSNLVQQQLMKHMEIDIHFVQDHDRTSLSVMYPSAPTAKGCIIVSI
nr:ribonuclease H-like domain-containing protein [Tanacetum cinerariifolium]